jgi:hypothetical protein
VERGLSDQHHQEPSEPSHPSCPWAYALGIVPSQCKLKTHLIGVKQAGNEPGRNPVPKYSAGMYPRITDPSSTGPWGSVQLPCLAFLARGQITATQAPEVMRPRDQKFNHLPDQLARGLCCSQVTKDLTLALLPGFKSQCSSGWAQF